jgi:hypothetical protein
MSTEKNLNELLNTSEITASSGDEATLAKAAKTAPAPVTTPASAPVTPVAPPASTFVSLYDFVNQHRAKLANASVTNIDGFSRVPRGKFMMFCTSEEEDAELVLFDRPNTLWIENNVNPDSIKVESSGLVIKCNNARYYIGKNNVSKVELQNGKVTSLSIISRAKTADAIKVENDTVTVQNADVDTVKLHVKRISPRLYNVIKDMTTKEQIKTGIEEFMTKIYDLNHLIKIEKELLLTLSL